MGNYQPQLVGRRYDHFDDMDDFDKSVFDNSAERSAANDILWIGVAVEKSLSVHLNQNLYVQKK